MHYESLRILGKTLGAHVHKRIGVLLVMIGLLIAHGLEIWVFALGYMLADWAPDMGSISGIESPRCHRLHVLVVDGLCDRRIRRPRPDRRHADAQRG